MNDQDKIQNSEEPSKVEEKASEQEAASPTPNEADQTLDTEESSDTEEKAETPTEEEPQHAEPEKTDNQAEPSAEELTQSAGETEIINAGDIEEVTPAPAEAEVQTEAPETQEVSGEAQLQEKDQDAKEDSGQARMTAKEDASEKTPEEPAPVDAAQTDEPAQEPAGVAPASEETQKAEAKTEDTEEKTEEETPSPAPEPEPESKDDPNAKWYVVHTYAGHENKVATGLKQRIETEHLEHKILDILVPTQDKIEIRGGKKETVKEKIFPGYILVKMILDDASWLAVRTTQGVTSFVGMGNKPTPISAQEVKSIVQYMSQGAPATFKDVFLVDDTVKIIDGPFADFIGKVDSVDKEKGKVRVLVSIFGRETPVELDFLQVQKL
jgi:transcription termination/antitermination protein NusG